MEVTMYKQTIFLKIAGSLLGLLVFFGSCSTDKDTPLPMDIGAKRTLGALIDQGEFLIEVSKKESEYIFHFENKDVKVPTSEIDAIHPDPDQWQTTVVFVDRSELMVPTKGSNLDFIVKKITLDPSGYNPLAARVDVMLPAYGRIKVAVLGKNGDQGTISHLCKSLTPSQEVPIFGLYADYNNQVQLTYTNKNGREMGTTQIAIQTKALPVPDLPALQVVKAEGDRMEPGVNLMNYPGASTLDLSIPYMVDQDGEIRWILWWKSSPDLKDISLSAGLERTRNGNFIAGDQNRHRIVEFDMFGNLIKEWDLLQLGYTFHHDVNEASNGNFLITVSKVNSQLNNGQPRSLDHIIELDPTSGSRVKEWDLATLIDTTRYSKPDGITPPQFAQSPNNWAHNNAIAEMGHDLLASMRYQGVIGFTPQGTLQWIISPYKHWSPQYQPYLLAPIDEAGNAITDPDVLSGDRSAEGFDWSWGTHTPIALSEDRILVFDNGYNRHWIENRLTPSDNYSRVVEYKINKSQRTVQQVWAYGQERGLDCFSQALSGIQYLSGTGNILFCPGMGVPTMQGRGGRIVEIDPRTRNVVFEMEITATSNTAFHRVTRMALYPEGI